MGRISFRNLPIAAMLLGMPVLAITLSGCPSHTHPMQASTKVPASEGTVRATEGTDGNTDVTISVNHLAIPSKVQGDSTIYVVWFQPLTGEAQNVGVMTVDGHLEGRFDGSTSHRRFHVTVTPEPNGEAARPSHPPVFTAEVDRQ